MKKNQTGAIAIVIILCSFGLSFAYLNTGSTFPTLYGLLALQGIQNSQDGMSEQKSSWIIENKGLYSIIGIDNDNCSDLTLDGFGWMDVWSNPWVINFSKVPTNTSKIFIEFKAKITKNGTYPPPLGFQDQVTYVSVNDPDYYPSQVKIWKTISGTEFNWYNFSFSTDLDGDGINDWTEGSNDIRILTWSGYSPAPADSGWDVVIISLDYDGNGIPDYKEKPPEQILMEEVIEQLGILKGSIGEINCSLLRIILTYITNKAENNMETALDLYLENNTECAKIRVWITKCQTCISEIIIKIADRFHIIEEEMAGNLIAQIDDIQLILVQILDLL